MSSVATAAPPDAVVLRVEAARQTLKSDRTRGLAEMNEIFREGHLPRVPLNGPTAGQMIAVDMGPLITPLAGALLGAAMPWCGKTFDAATASGDNVFYKGFTPVSRLLFPFYGGYRPVGADRVRGLPFRSYTGSGLKDPDRSVLKIDYDTPANPAGMRRVLDELVQVDDNYYFGKAYVRLTSRTWHLTFYFALQRA